MSSNSPVRLIFMGSDAIALPTLDYLIGESKRIQIEAVYTQPDRARGRGKKVQPNAIKQWASDRGIEVYQPDKFGEEEIEFLKQLKPEIILVMAYGHILPQDLLDLPTKGIYNIHTSLLPSLRGASPIETAVASGLSESGLTLMRLVLKMDAGPICDQETLEISPLETGGDYRDKLAQASPSLLRRNLRNIIDGSVQSRGQQEDDVSYCRLLVKQDGQLDFSHSARELACRINGLNPWPGCFVRLDEAILKVGLATWSEYLDFLPVGEVLSCDSDGIAVGTGDGLLKLLALQKPGGKMLSVDDFLRGYPIEPGSLFTSQEMHPLISKKPVSHKRVFQLYTKP